MHGWQGGAASTAGRCHRDTQLQLLTKQVSPVRYLWKQMFEVFLNPQCLGGLVMDVQGHKQSICLSIVAFFGQRIILYNIVIKAVFQR